MAGPGHQRTSEEDFMPTCRSLSVLAAATLTSSVSLGAQDQVWTVDDDGPADFNNLTSAIAAAGDQDVILVKDGDYFGSGGPIVVDGKALTFVADGSNVKITDAEVRVENLTAGQGVVFRGLDGDGSHFIIQNNVGTVWIEDGYFGPALDGSAIPRFDVIASASVNVLRSFLLGEKDTAGVFPGGSGIQTALSLVNLYDCTVEGGVTGIFGPGAPAAHLIDAAVLFASGCSFAGDTVIGDILLGDGFPSLYLLDSTGSTSVTSGLVTNFTGEARSFQAPSPLREGETGLYTYTGDPADVVILVVGLEPASLLFPQWKGAFLSTPIPGPIVKVLGSPAIFGILQEPFIAPAIPLGFETGHFVPQVGILTGAGEIQLGPASHVTFLSSSL